MLHSCNMCSHSNEETLSVEENTIDNNDSTPKYGTSLLSVGYPIVPDTLSSELIERICYSVSYNGLTRQPNWVMWQLTDNHVMTKKEGVWNEYREDLSIKEEYVEYLGNKLVCFTIPLSPGRNSAVIVETAAVNFRQKRMGYDAGKELERRIMEKMARDRARK